MPLPNVPRRGHTEPGDSDAPSVFIAFEPVFSCC